jgi:outer membrane protein assembly factor BamB
MNGTRRLVLIAGASALGGCALWPWSSSEPKLPELPSATGEASLRAAWTASLEGGGIGFQPLVIGDSILAASTEGEVVRLDAANGRPIWRTELETALIGGIGSDGETSVVAGRDGTLIALDAEGRQKWRVPNGAEVVTVPAVGMGLVVVRGSNNRVSAYELETGQRRWLFDRQGPALVLRQTASLAMDPSTVYVGLPGGRLVALALNTGALKWESAVGMPRGSNEIERIADVVGSPLLSGGDVCAAAWQGRVTCYDATTGRIGWSRELAAAAGIDLDSGLLVAVDSEGEVHGLSRSGASMWRQDKLRRRQPSAPLLTGSHVAVGDSQGLLHLLSREDGSLVARVDTDRTAIFATPVGWRDLVVAQTSDGTLFAFQVE